MHRGYLLAPTAFFLVVACVVLFQFPRGSWVPVWRFADTPAKKASSLSGETQIPTDPISVESTPSLGNHPTNRVTSSNPSTNGSARQTIPGSDNFSSNQPGQPSPVTSASGDNRTATISRRSPIAILVLGAVDSPGELTWPNAQFPQTVLGAIRAVGGFGPLASVKTIRLTRTTTDGKTASVTVNAIATNERGQDLSPNVQPGDVIFVPELMKNSMATTQTGTESLH